MAENSLQFHETDYGNRYLISDSAQVEKAQRLARTILRASLDPTSIAARIRGQIACMRLNNMVTVTMGNYEDDKVQYTPASGVDLAWLVISGTEEKS